MSYNEVLHFFIEVPAEEYHADAKEFLSSHAIIDYIKSPAVYRQKELGIIPRLDTPAFSLGRAAHVLILEGEQAYKKQYAIGGPINETTGKPYGASTKKFKEWAESQDREVISNDDHASVLGMALGVKQNKRAVELLSNGRAEGVIREWFGGQRCQIRCDWFNPVCGIVDLKTTRDISVFQSDAKRYSYLYQLAFYQEIIFQKTGFIVPVSIIAVQKTAPYFCGVFEIDRDELLIAASYIRQAVFNLSVSNDQNFWPTGYDKTTTLKLLED